MAHHLYFWLRFLPFPSRKEYKLIGTDAKSDYSNYHTEAVRLDYLMRLGSLALYTVVAVAMNFVNKFTMQIYPLPNVVLVLQMIVTIMSVTPTLMTSKSSDRTLFSLPRFKQLFLIAFLYTSNTALALFGLKTLNVPMYSTLKRLTPMMVLLCKALWTRTVPARSLCLSVFLVVLGCVVAGYGDLSFNAMGYTFAIMSCVLQASYLVSVEAQGAKGMETSVLLYYTAITSLPFLLVVSYSLGEIDQMVNVFNSAAAQNGPLITLFVISLCACGGVLLNFSMFLCTISNTALTTTVAGVLRSVVVVLLGFFVLGGIQFSWLNILGITLNLVGGIWYTWTKTLGKSGRPDHGSKSAMILSPSLGELPVSSYQTKLQSPSPSELSLSNAGKSRLSRVPLQSIC